MSRDVPSIGELLHEVTELLGPDAAGLTEQDSLIEWGMDSIQLMRLASGWRRRGIDIGFAQLAKRPTLAQWRELLAESLAAGPQSTSAVSAASAASVSTSTSESASIPVPVDESAPFPLALMQHAYWIGRGEDAALGSVAAHLYVEFDGEDVDPDRLERAVNALVRRHGMLRARFTDDGRQQILPTRRQPALIVTDLRKFDAETVAATLEELRDAGSHARLDVAEGEVFAASLSLLPGGATRLHFDVDMLAADALSYRVLLADLATLYADPDSASAPSSPSPSPAYSYPRYLADREPARREARERARRWWQQRVPELPSAPDLPLAPEGTRGDPTRVTRLHHWLNPADKRDLIARAHKHGLTPAMAVATAFAEVMSAWSGHPRFLLNLPLFDREPTHPDVGRIVGDFTGSVLLDVDLSAPNSFVGHAWALQARMHTDGEHADYSGVEVLRDLSRHHGEQVLAPVVFTSALNLGELFDPTVRSCFGDAVWIVSQGPQVLLDAQITEVDGGLLINWDVREQAFPPGLVREMFAAFRDLVTRLGREDAAWLQPVPALLPAEQAAVRARVNATDTPRSGRLLHDGFFARAASRPDLPALLWGEDGELRYGELADQALRVAAALRSHGVAPGDTVAVSLPKGPDQIVAVLGVLAAGGTYVPVGIEQPPARRSRIRRSAGFRVVLGESAEVAIEGTETLRLAAALAHVPLAAPIPPPEGEESLAYVLFTSGSTGEPKGVELPHRAAVNTIDDLNARFGVTEADRCLAVSALDFDLSVYDVFGLLAAGGGVVLVGQEDKRDAREWARLAAARGVTLVNCVPALLDMLLLAAHPGELAGLRTVILGGDWVGAGLPARVAEQAPGCRFAGLGGTTETAIHSTVCEVTGPVPEHWTSVPYGTPLSNVRCRVVDVRGRDCPDWVPGELWIGGDGVARGYRADPERSADRFVEHEDARWYRTGDLACYWPDGTLEFLGRRDHQVKVHGVRIELGEVESALAGHPGVRRAVAGVSGGQLVAAVCVTGAYAGGALTGDQLRDWSATLLPPHLLPSRVAVLDELPLTANGKVDRRAVERNWQTGAGAGTSAEAGGRRRHVAPTTALERVVALVWAEVLGAPKVGMDEPFFGLGGDSVLATVIVGRLREALDTAGISVRALFAAPTVGALADRLRAEEPVPGRLERVAAIYLEVEALSAAELASELLDS